MPSVARTFTHEIAIKFAGQPATMIVIRDLKTSLATLWLKGATIPAIELSPEAHADLLQALSFPPCPGVANAKPERITNHASRITS
jgi:hypothetical protein